MSIKHYTQEYSVGGRLFVNKYLVNEETGKVLFHTYERSPLGLLRLVCEGPWIDLSDRPTTSQDPSTNSVPTEDNPNESESPERKWIVTDITKKYDPQVILGSTYQDTANNYIHRIQELSLPPNIKIEPAHPCQYGEECPVNMCCGECYQKFVKNAGLQRAYYMNREGDKYVATEERDHV